MIVTAILCGHVFDTDDFENYPEYYSGYCPNCMKYMKDRDAEDIDSDEEPDGVGLKEYDGESFDDEEFTNNDDSDLDEYEEDENEMDVDPFADETEEDEEREVSKEILEDVAYRIREL